ncbi:MAG: hypothetical protein IJR13_08340 [Bacteroidales bacterium]|nr:hypothetical protein [Bacteroidales bacterium]
MRKVIVSTMLLLLLTAPVSAQMRYGRHTSQRQLFNRQGRNAFTLEVGSSATAYLFEGNLAAVRPGIGGRLQAGYSIFSDRTFGFHFGLGFAYSHCGMEVSDIESSTIGTIDAYNNSQQVTRTAHYTTQTPTAREKYHSFFIEMPLQMSFRDDHFWMDAGVKVLLPITVEAAYDYDETTIGVGYDIDGFGTSVPVPIEVEHLPQTTGNHHVADIAGGTLCYPAYVLFAVSGGYRWAVDERKICQIGFYLDVAINRTHAGGDNGIVDVSEQPFHYTNLLRSDNVKALRYVDAGIVFTYNFSFGRKISYVLRTERSQYNYRGARTRR